jgi:ferredoxin
MARGLRIRGDYDRCVGPRLCVLTAPGVFPINDW